MNLPAFVSPELLLTLSALLMVITALTHSILGERRLLRPIFELRHVRPILDLGEDEKPNILRLGRTRRILRFAWHFTSLFMGLTALVVIWPDMPIALIAVTGALWFFVGIFDAIYTRGKHIGWPLLTAAGALSLAAVYLLAGISL
jgi:hypothetical protein